VSGLLGLFSTIISGAPGIMARKILCKSARRSNDVTDHPHGPAFAFIRADCGVAVSTEASTGDIMYWKRNDSIFNRE
jgi:hypothetical protein